MNKDKGLGFNDFISYETSKPNFSRLMYRNIVLRSKQRARTDEPTGEVENLDVSKLSKFGDMVKRRKAPKIPKHSKTQGIGFTVKRGSIVDVDVHTHKPFYQPKTPHTNVVFEDLLNFVVKFCGDVDSETIHSVVDEVLREIKDDSRGDEEKMRTVSSILVGISEDEFSSLIRIGKQITDYFPEEFEMEDDQGAEDLGMSLVFDKKDDIPYVDVINDEDEDEEIGVEANTNEVLEFRSDNKISVKVVNEEYLLQTFQRSLNDEKFPKEKLDSILSVLSSKENMDVDCENELSEQLNFNMDLLEFIITNRWEIVFGMAFFRNPNQKEEIINEIRGQKNLQHILVELGESSSVNTDKTSVDVLDLESLEFNLGSRLMSNKECQLPSNLKRSTFPSYEEIFIPPPQVPVVSKEEFLPISSLPLWAQKAFPYESMNRIQSKVCKSALFDDGNLLVCAPTGAGKTNIAVLCILREIGKFSEIGPNGEFRGVQKNFKIVYIAPMKALVQEVVGKLKGRLTSEYGVQVGELTGDSTMTRTQIENTHVIVATPEKWDIVTRKREDRTFADNVKLVIIDEIHLLHDERGPVLEAIIARTLRFQERFQLQMRLIGVSATLPNYKDVALLLRVDPQKNLYHFDGTFRPVPLEQIYVGVSERKALKRLRIMNEVCYNKVIERSSKDQQIIIFVHSRKETGRTASFIRDCGIENGTIRSLLEGRKASEHILKEVAEQDVKNEELRSLLPYGLAIHHAGMLRNDRKFVEDLFSDKHVRVLVSTATLAWGVNLPAHTVIIKGTQVYNPEKSMWTELSFLDVMQMMGRAGRPDFDKTGEGILITSDRELLYYLSLLNQQLPVESQFVKKLCDNINSEIVQGSIENVRQGVDYLGYTYLYIRMMKNPSLYQIERKNKEEDPKLLLHRERLVVSSALKLHKHGLIVFDRSTGNFQPTPLGRIASHYYLPFSSMSTYCKYLQPHLTEIDLFRVFALSEEFKFLVCRLEEKVELQRLYNSLPIPIKESFEEPSAKVNILLQSYISKKKLRCFSLVSDLTYVIQSAARILRAMFEIALVKGWSQLSIRLLTISKMVERRMWVSQSPLRQFKSISEKLLQRLEKKDISWDQLYDLSVAELGELIRFPKKGRELYKTIHQFPRLDLSAQVQPITYDLLKFDIVLQADFQFVRELHGSALMFHLFVEDTSQDEIFHRDIFLLREKVAQREHFLSFTLTIPQNLPEPLFFIRVVSDRWVGSETVLPVFLKDLILPKRVPNNYSFLDETISPISLREDLFKNNSELLQFFKSDGVNRLNSQVLTKINSDEENIFVGLPVGANINFLVKYSIIHGLRNFKTGKIVVLSPRIEDSSKLHNELNIGLKSVMKVENKLLSNEKSVKSSLSDFNSSRVLFSDFEIFDPLTRKWNESKDLFSEIRVVVVKDLHMIGGSKGHIIEIVMSRLLLMKKILQSKCRFICFGLSVECPLDLSLWLGSPKNYLNFHPSEMGLSSFNVEVFSNPSHRSRVISMARRCYLLFKKENKKRVVVYCSSPKICEGVCKDILSYIHSEISENNTKEEMNDRFEGVESPFLKRLCENGIAYLHSSMNLKDKLIVSELYSQSLLRFLVIDRNFAFDLSFSSELVVILGTEYFNGNEQRFCPYSIVEVCKMISVCAKNNGGVIVFCKPSLSKYYETFLIKRSLPIESQLDHSLADHVNAEISNGLVESPQNAVDFLTNTFLFRRVRRNPNYYNLHGLSSQHLQEYLSQLIENTLNDLVSASCIEVDEHEGSFQTLNLGRISSEMYINFSTVDLFNSSITSETKMRGILEILSASSEFDDLPIRENEDVILKRMSKYAPLKISDRSVEDSQVKVNLLLQAHFSRLNLESNLIDDLNLILKKSWKLLRGMVNVISSNGWIKPVISAIELQQMIMRAVWDSDSYFRQIPGFTMELCEKMEKNEIENIFDLIEMDDGERSSLLADFGDMDSLASFLNQYPNIDIEFQVVTEKITPGSLVMLKVDLETDDGEVLNIPSPFFPGNRDAEWWLLLGDVQKNRLVGIKSFEIRNSLEIGLKFPAPKETGEYSYTLFLMCDSYVGCDQEYEVRILVQE